MTCLFVGNLTKNLTEQKLYESFNDIGPCQVELKGRYAFVEYESPDDANRAIRSLNATTLGGCNGYAKVRIELSRKKRVNDKLEDNDGNYYHNAREIELAESSDEEVNNYNITLNSQKVKSNEREKNQIEKKEEQQKRNICFICKLPGHFAKECVLTKESCYECGEKGHMAKECVAGVRNAKVLTKNRVKAIFSQQSAFRFTNPKLRVDNILMFIRENGVN